MSDSNDPSGESQVTTDRETIREWASEHDVRPVRHTSRTGERTEYMLLPESEHGANHESADWNNFFQAVERDDLAVVYHGSGREKTFQVLEHDNAVSQSTLSSNEVTERLLDGETVTTEVTETAVVEETIVEHADIESEVIGSERISEAIMDAELLSRDVRNCEMRGLDEQTTVSDNELFDVGYTQSETLDVEVLVDEQWTVTTEIVDRIAIESRVVDTDVEGSESIEADAVETRVDLGDVERTLLQSDVIDAPHQNVDVMDTKSIESGFTEDDTIVTELVERKTIKEDVGLERQFTGIIDESETMEIETARSEVIESDLTDAHEYNLRELETDSYDRPETNIPAGSTAGETGQMAETDLTGEDVRATPNEDDQGKTVVDSEGEAVGIVADVRSGTMHVDPHPSLTDKIKAKLDWGDIDEDNYVLESNQVERITDDEVRLRGYQ